MAKIKLQQVLYIRTWKGLDFYPEGKTHILDIINDINQSKGEVLFTSMIDRTGFFENKMKMKILSPMPTNYNSSYTFADCCDERAAELLGTGKDITISWSGGIAATAVLVSFLKLVGGTPDQARLKVLLTPKSIEEYPLFYNTYIKDKIRTELYVDKHLSKYNVAENELLIRGRAVCIFGRQSDIAHKTKTVEEWFNFQTQSIGYLQNPTIKSVVYDNITQFLAATCPYPVNNGYDAIRWLKFALSWQNRNSTDFRFNMYDKTNIVNRVSFFDSEQFQKWTIANHTAIMSETIDDHRTEMKDYVYDYTNDSEYRNTKRRIGSSRLVNFNDPDFQSDQILKTLVKQNKCPIMIDSTYTNYTLDEVIPRLSSENLAQNRATIAVNNTRIKSYLVLPSDKKEWISVST
jgi:hypothetical protein